MASNLKILIIDKSVIVQKRLTDIINSENDMSVVGVASDPYAAREKIKRLQPDILTLDVNLPRMDGITFLRNLMRLRPMPVLMVIDDDKDSLEFAESSRIIGAKDVILKQSILQDGSCSRDVAEFIDKIRKAVNKREESGTPAVQTDQRYCADVILEYAQPRVFRSAEPLIAIGASTGGTEAIKNFILKLPVNTPAIVVTQHIPGSFSAAFASRINRLTPLEVAEAKDGEVILPGHVYIAPGDRHLLVKWADSCYRCSLNDGPPVNRHKPSVDVLFRSVAQTVGPHAIGVLLTGMGSDGAAGLLEMKKANAPTVAQDEETSVVWGMPGSAVKLGAVDEVLPLDKIADYLLSKLKVKKKSDNVKEFTQSRRFKS